MSLTPNDILEKRFSVSFRGYSRDEVDKFLEFVAESLTSAIKELNALKDQSTGLRVKLDSLQEREEEFRKALTTAHTFAEEMKQQAKKDSELMLERATMDAERIISDAHQEAIQLEENIRGLRRIQREAVFKIRSSIEGYLHLLDDAMLPPEELDNLLSAAANDMRAIQGRGDVKVINSQSEISNDFKDDLLNSEQDAVPDNTVIENKKVSDKDKNNNIDLNELNELDELDTSNVDFNELNEIDFSKT